MCRLKGHDLIKLLFYLLILNHFQLCMVSSFHFEVKNIFSENFKLGIQNATRGERFKVLGAKPLNLCPFLYCLSFWSYSQQLFLVCIHSMGKAFASIIVNTLKQSSMVFRILLVNSIAILLSLFIQMHIDTLVKLWYLRMRY